MIESPLIQEIVAEREREAKQEAKQEAILEVLQTRFGSVVADIAERLRGVRGEKKLNALLKHAVRCPDLEAFRKRLPI